MCPLPKHLVCNQNIRSVTKTFGLLPKHFVSVTKTFGLLPKHFVSVTKTFGLLPKHFVSVTKTFGLLPKHSVCYTNWSMQYIVITNWCSWSWTYSSQFFLYVCRFVCRRQRMMWSVYKMDFILCTEVCILKVLQHLCICLALYLVFL